MALPNVLSAMREVILDDLSIPLDEEARITFFKIRFPLLSNEEVEDFSKIKPDRFKIYTGTIFNGAAASIRPHFTITLAYLQANWKQVYGKSFRLAGLIKAVQAKYPWKGYLTEQLCKNIIRYISEDLPEIRAHLPVVGEIAHLEFLVFHLTRASEENTAAENSLSIQELKELTVEEMLELSFTIPRNVTFHRFRFDVLEVFHYFYEHNQTLPKSLPHEENFWIIGGRNKAHSARFMYLSEPMFSYLSATNREEKISLSSFAEAFVTCASQDTSQEQNKTVPSEEELFLNFSKLILDLMGIGAVVLLA